MTPISVPELFSVKTQPSELNRIESYLNRTSMKNTESRLITSFQSIGRMGRSTFQQGLISWFGLCGRRVFHDRLR
jgi:hypothetical protein